MQYNLAIIFVLGLAVPVLSGAQASQLPGNLSAVQQHVLHCERKHQVGHKNLSYGITMIKLNVFRAKLVLAASILSDPKVVVAVDEYLCFIHSREMYECRHHKL